MKREGASVRPGPGVSSKVVICGEGEQGKHPWGDELGNLGEKLMMECDVP